MSHSAATLAASGLPGASPGANPLRAILRPRGRDLTIPELRAFVTELSERPELWIDMVAHDATQRHYEELLCDQHLTAWLICWMNDHDTGFHDHDVSAGAVAVVGGSVREERLTLGSAPRERVFAVGDIFHFLPSDIHRISHAGSHPAVTLHVYSPPLLRMGAYFVDDDGLLARRPMTSGEELQAP
ncbi:MAG TPA: cysteine dioxygenase family protein [Solirubrobacteraceae bacterium]|jgi:predicted metal-dependent enzyme (double-stranded beta helix superfamily)|nr:cysteine dioxygenase family protein [Solirubrobacteraceae bacterium]